MKYYNLLVVLMMLTLQLYDIDVVYIPGTKLYIPDTLSRAPLSFKEEHIIDKEIAINASSFVTSLSVSQSKIILIKKETTNDKSLQTLIKYFYEGWPKNRGETDLSVRPYWNYRLDIHVIDDLVFKNTSLIIPITLRKEMLQQIHSRHLGIKRSKSLARGSIFWPSMSSDIEQVVNSCHTCMKYKSANPKEPLILSETPSCPWEKVGADLMQFRDKKYLVVVDYYSKYIELALLNTSTTAKHVTIHFRSIFARHGIPLQLYTDNGPPFDSKEFKSFCFDWDIEHVTSSPNFPKSNGQAESAVKIVKRILQKSHEENKDPFLALLHYRSNEKEYMKSPAELLMSRKLRTNLPITKELLKPKVVQFQNQQKEFEKHKINYKKYYDRTAKDLVPLEENDSVMFKKTPNSYWEPGVVKEVLKDPRSYLVESECGAIYRRNRQHLFKNNSVSQRNETLNHKSDGNQNKQSLNQSLTMSVPRSSTFMTLCLPTCDSQELSQNVSTKLESENNLMLSSETSSTNNSCSSLIELSEDAHNMCNDCGNDDCNKTVYKTRSGRSVHRPSKFN